MADIVWGLDIGGTKSAVIIGDGDGRILLREQVATADYHGNWRALVDALLALPGGDAPRPLAIGVSCGGPLDSARGLILSPPNLPGWDNVPITAYLREKMGVPAFVQNDANACALAEWQFGAGRGCRNMVFLTFGTGMGAGLILNGRLYTGTNDMAGEVGHIRLAPDGPVGFHQTGSFEGFCSGGGIRQLAQLRLGRDLTARDLALLADEGDADALRVLHESTRQLGMALSVLIDVLNPQKIVIGSIFARAERHFRSEMERMIAQETLALSRSVCEVVPAALGERIGDIAALTVAFTGLKEEKS